VRERTRGPRWCRRGHRLLPAAAKGSASTSRKLTVGIPHDVDACAWSWSTARAIDGTRTSASVGRLAAVRLSCWWYVQRASTIRPSHLAHPIRTQAARKQRTICRPNPTAAMIMSLDGVLLTYQCAIAREIKRGQLSVVRIRESTRVHVQTTSKHTVRSAKHEERATQETGKHRYRLSRCNHECGSGSTWRSNAPSCSPV
jgi:hypothetical protein